ncbi:MAG: hypothetical protein ACK58M_20345 [Acidobacteriota bacterium]|jgi:hypothetical protein
MIKNQRDTTNGPTTEANSQPQPVTKRAPLQPASPRKKTENP